MTEALSALARQPETPDPPSGAAPDPVLEAISALARQPETPPDVDASGGDTA